MMVLGVSSTIVYTIKTSSLSSNTIKASLMAKEGLEAYRDLVKEDVVNLTNGLYGLSYASGKWSVSGTTDNSEGFIRQITVADDPTNSVDPILSKKVTSTVTYNGGTQTYSISTLLTNWRRYKAPIVVGYWAFPYMKGSLDINLGTYTMTRFVKVGNYIYGIRPVANTNNLIVLDVTDPAVPTYVTQFSVLGTPSDIDVGGNYLYISSSDNNRELTVVDITNRTAPTYYSTYNANSTTDATSVLVVGNRLYFTRLGAAPSNEFMILDITTPSSISVAGQYKVPSNITVYDSRVIGNYAYLATVSNTQELIVLDISVEASPVLYGSLDIPTTNDAYYIKAIGTTTLLISDVTTNLNAVDITTPASPTLLSQYNIGARAYQIDVNGDNTRAFLATALSGNELRVLNISNLSSISAFGGYNETGNVAVNGVLYDSTANLIYGTTTIATKELAVYQPSYTNWNSPSLQATLDITGSMNMIKIIKVGSYIYGIRSVAGTNNLIVMNVSNPLSPSYITQFSVDGIPTDITHYNNHLFISSTDDTREITVVDISNPLIPVYAGFYNAPNATDTASIANFGASRVYLGRVGNATDAEVLILDITTPATPSLLGSYNTPSNNTVNGIEKISNNLFLAVALGSQELVVVNVTNEASPTITGSLNLSLNTLGRRIHAINTNTILIGDATTSIYTINVATPASPTQLGVLSAGALINDIEATTDATAALMATNNSAYDFEVMNTANLSQLSTIYGLNYSTTINSVIYDSSQDLIFAAPINVNGELIVIRPNY